MQKVDLTELQGAVEWVSDSVADSEAYVCRLTGRIFWISDDGDLDQDGPPSDVDDTDKYVPVPNKYELDIGTRLVFDFAKCYLPDRYDEVRSVFRRRGAYGRFKALLAGRDLLDEWYAFSEEQTLSALGEWCTSEGLAAQQDVDSSA